MLEQMMSKMNTVNMDTSVTTRATTPNHIDLLPPGIDDSSTMAMSTTSVTSDSITQKKMELPETRKFSRTDHWEILFDPKNHIHMTKNQTTIKHKVERFMMHLR